ncbi:MAG: Gfo/Idh/MocA family oxidoreductase [Planctomycetes bacterium]|nr:Gfo/Idh/MocA family oxidoreductase [Planctomycetota bacterium]
MGEKNIGIIGCGGRIRGVVNNVLQNSGDVRVVAVFDPEPKSVAAAKENYGDGIRVCGSVAELVGAQDVDWVFIGSWNCCHREHAIAALEAGKDVFCEKPLATSIADCLDMKKAWKKSGRVFSLGLVLRYSPHYQKIKEIVESGEIGKIISMEFNETLHFDHGGYIHGDWRRLEKNAGSHLLEKCCHDIDLALWILDDLPKRVASFGGCDFFVPENAGEVDRIGKSESGRDAFSSWLRIHDENPFTAEKDIVDNQVAILECYKGARVTFHTNCSTSIPERRMYICGGRGTLRADVLTGEIEMQTIGYDSERRQLGTGSSGGHGGADGFLAKSIVETMFKGKPPMAGIEEGLRSNITAMAIDKAMKDGIVVELSSIWHEAGVPVA